ncbi:helix-turn-helix domain-containing protein [Neptuniibacter sp. QD37_6]|uniref:helix-turn-helix domain-containing protein n=1 Tax=Neptuniibacter sp. QD37_6 TaxID=3398210 RepID=UPI0039F6381C
MGPKLSIPFEKQAEIIRIAQAGLIPKTKIAKQFNISRQKVYDILKEFKEGTDASK